jgi:hypothetical protein
MLPLLQSCTIDEDSWPGSLTITADDSEGYDPGAEIILDGRETTYQTPHTFTDLETGEHTVVLVAANYSMIDTSAFVVFLDNDNSHADVEILMLRNHGTLVINPLSAGGDPVVARVIIDLQSSYSPAPCLLSIPTGQHLLHLAADGYTVVPESLAVDVGHNEEQELEFLMIPVVGDSYQVDIDAVDEDGHQVMGLEVWLDGLPYGYSTPAQFSIAPDDVDHLLELRSGYSVRAEHLVAAGQQTLLLWEPVISEIKLEIMSTPTGMPIYIDEQVTGFNTPYQMSLTGSHFVSVAGAGYATSLPGGWQLDIVDDTQIEITLEAVTAGVQVGQVATDFVLPLFDSDPDANMTLHQFRGRVVLLNFWFYN